jgi:hypothetical protein
MHFLNNHKQEYRFVKLDESRIKDLIFLYRYCFGFEPTEQELLQKHLNSSGTFKFIGFIAYTPDNKPAAYYGVFPQIIRFQKRDYLVAQSGDTMTHPDHQKKGLFIALANHTFEYCKSIKISAIFGFPNSNSYPGFINKLNFVELDRLEGNSFYENRFEYARFFSRNKNKYNLFVSNCLKKIFKPGDFFENSNSNTPFAYVKHDVLYFKSKFKKTNLILKVKGIDVFLKISGNTLSIGDINSADVSKIESVIKCLKKWCFVLGLRFINFDSTTNSFLNGKINGLNPFKFQSNRSIFLNLDTNLPFSKIEFLGSDIDVF